MFEVENTVVVAVKAEKEISKSALEWALTHIVRPGDFVTLLAVIPNQTKGRRWSRLWNFPKLGIDSGSITRQNFSEDCRRCQVSASCSQMALQFHGPGDRNEVNMRIKVLTLSEGASPDGGAVAVESKRVGANWIVLDKQLKQEAKLCLEDLHCNIVLMNHKHAKVLRLNLGALQPKNHYNPLPNANNIISDGEVEDDHNRRDASSIQEYNSSTSKSFYKQNPLFENFLKAKLSSIDEDSGGGSNLSPLSTKTQIIQQKHILYEDTTSGKKSKHSSTTKTLQENFAESNTQPFSMFLEHHLDYGVGNKPTDPMVSICRSSPSVPPPLCSVCQHKTPMFGKPPKWFAYEELEDATNHFSEENFLAEGGFGWVHRGLLSDGQVVAVKRLKLTWSSKDNSDFQSEVEILSRAQHRNVVLLIGFCVRGETKILVYEYVCNGSLDFHLYGRSKAALDWHARTRIAVGAARGLRYLHEDCRVGFVHRDVRPNNILLTHDFEPMVGDFGLARWQSEGGANVDTRVVGTFGYLAPEYIETGVITEKADIYAFGVVLLQLMSGRRAMDLSLPKGQQFLLEWARPLLRLVEEPESYTHNIASSQFMDPRLDREELEFCSNQLSAMAHAASLCLRRDPLSRPSMSKVLRILEGDETLEFRPSSCPPGSTTGHTDRPMTRKHAGPKGSHSMRFSRQTISDVVFSNNHNRYVM